MNVNINTLSRDLQTRFAMNEEVVQDYADKMTEGIIFPPVTVIANRLVDGYHRVEAALRIGRTEIDAEVLPGDKTAALLAALKANATHGLYRTNADKRRALEIAWNSPELSVCHDHLTERKLAEMCGVSTGTAHNFLSEMELLKMSNTDSEEEIEEVSERSERRKLQKHQDIYGQEIPDELLPVFKAKLPKDHLKMLRRIRTELKNAIEARDYTYAAASQRLLVDLENIITAFKFGAPYAVCPVCRGMKCDRCGKRGYMNREQYRRLPSEYKN